MVEKQLGKPIIDIVSCIVQHRYDDGAFSSSLFAKLDTGLFIHFGAIS